MHAIVMVLLGLATIQAPTLKALLRGVYPAMLGRVRFVLKGVSREFVLAPSGTVKEAGGRLALAVDCPESGFLVAEFLSPSAQVYHRQVLGWVSEDSQSIEGLCEATLQMETKMEVGRGCRGILVQNGQSVPVATGDPASATITAMVTTDSAFMLERDGKKPIIGHASGTLPMRPVSGPLPEAVRHAIAKLGDSQIHWTVEGHPVYCGSAAGVGLAWPMEVLSNASQSEPWSFDFYIGVSGQATSLEGTCEINCRGESIVRSLRHVGARTVAFQDGQTSQAWQHVRELGDVFGSVYYPSKDLESALLNGPVSMPSMVLGGACGAILKGLVELEGSQEFIFAGELHTKGRMDVWSISQKEGQYSIHRERCCMARVNEGEPLEPSEKFKQLRSGLSIVGPGNCKPGRARLSSLLIGIGVASLTWSERDELRWKGAVVNPGDTLRWSRGGWQLVPALRAVVK